MHFYAKVQKKITKKKIQEKLLFTTICQEKCWFETQKKTKINLVNSKKNCNFVN